MKQPRVHKQPIRRDRKIMAALDVANARRGVVIVPIPAHLASEAVSDDPGAARAMARLIFPAGKNALVAGKPIRAASCAGPCPWALQKSDNCMGSSPFAASGRPGDVSALNLIGGPQSTKLSVPCLMAIPW
jgi:hypothetical protein